MRVSTANFSIELRLWNRGLKYLAGADEVGRGSFAGPVVAACVVFQKGETLRNQGFSFINDSKKLTRKQREIAEKWIKENALAWGIGEASPALINRIGMGKAAKMAFREAVANANRKLEVRSEIKSHFTHRLPHSHFSHRTSGIQYLLIDAFYIPRIRGLRKDKQLPIINGDEKSISIAAASIIAKVYRDSLMINLSNKTKYKNYGWGRNKGYGTRQHRDAIFKYGITGYHRSAFVETYLNNRIR